jgi:hypothetical protein
MPSSWSFEIMMDREACKSFLCWFEANVMLDMVNANDAFDSGR